jgi:outer membrane protein assembly factor BamB
MVRARSANNCPQCGAPLSGPSSERCDYCGASLRSAAAEHDRNLAGAMASSRSIWRKSWIFTGLIVGASLVVGLVGQLTTRKAVRRASEATQSFPDQGSKRPPAPSEGQPPSHDLSELLAILPSGPDGPRLLFSTTSPGAVTLLEAATARPLWRATPATARVPPDAVALHGERILVVTESKVVALQVRDGSIAWQASLVADYAPFGNPAKVLADRLLVQLRDGTTQAIDIGSGKTVGAVRQIPPPQRLLAAGKVRVDIRYNDQKRGKPLEVFVSDVATGNELRVFAPRCATHSIIPANQPGPSAPVLLSDDGNDLYLFYGFNRFCIDRWDLRSGTRVWQVNRDKGFLETSARETRLLADDERIVYVGTDGVYQVRRRDGEVVKLVGSEQSKLVPTYLANNLLVLAATPAWESAECKRAKICALWGVDLAKREVRWRYTLPNLGDFPSSSERFAGVLSVDALALVANGPAGQVVFDRIDPVTGVSRLHRELLPASTDRHVFRVPEISLAGGLAWFQADGFHAVDLTSGTVRYHVR